jgi:hypothetical protein
MTARTDLDNAFSILDAGITAHVAALKTAHAASQDETYVASLTAKVLKMADTLSASNPAPVVAVVPAAVITTPVAPAVAPVAPVAPVAVVAPQAPVAAPQDLSGAALLHDPGATPAMIAAAIAKMHAAAPAAPAAQADMLSKLEDAIKGMIPKK